MLLGYLGIFIKNDNSGFSLVELIVAISVGAIISGAIASIIVISTRMYSRETTNIAEQYEIQATLNQTVDSAENAQWIALGNTVDGIATEYVAFGKLTDLSGSLYFEGEIFTCDYDPTAPGKFNVYMNRYSGTSLNVGSESEAGGNIESTSDTIKTAQYLLGEGAMSYVVSFVEEDEHFDDSVAAKMSDGVTPAAGVFVNPLIVSICMDFKKESMTGEINKHVEDKVTFRNRIKRPVYLKDKGYFAPQQ